MLLDGPANPSHSSLDSPEPEWNAKVSDILQAKVPTLHHIPRELASDIANVLAATIKAFVNCPCWEILRALLALPKILLAAPL